MLCLSHDSLRRSTVYNYESNLIEDKKLGSEVFFRGLLHFRISQSSVYVVCNSCILYLDSEQAEQCNLPKWNLCAIVV